MRTERSRQQQQTKTAEPRARVFLKPGQDRRVAQGHPWVYSNELRMDEEARALAPGTLVALHRVDGKPIGLGSFNPHTLIAFRLFTLNTRATVDCEFLAARLRRALKLREAVFAEPFYRLVHAEADGLPGLIVDRFDDVLVLQLNTAGIDRQKPVLLEAIEQVLAPKTIVLRNDSPARAVEGLAQEVVVANGTVDDLVPVRESGLTFAADVLAGQKTGWYFDQSRNRAFVAPLARKGSMLDMYCHSGAFAISATAAGAARAVGIDSSEAALALGRHAAAAAGVEAKCTFHRGDAFSELEQLSNHPDRFRLVVADPPPFARSRKEVGSALRGYRKLARLAAAVVEPCGFLFLASCSHNVEAGAFTTEVTRGVARAGRCGRIIRQAGAGPDHPVHLHLPETAYLKSALMQLD